MKHKSKTSSKAEQKDGEDDTVELLLGTIPLTDELAVALLS